MKDKCKGQSIKGLKGSVLSNDAQASQWPKNGELFSLWLPYFESCVQSGLQTV